MKQGSKPDNWTPGTIFLSTAALYYYLKMKPGRRRDLTEEEQQI